MILGGKSPDKTDTLGVVSDGLKTVQAQQGDAVISDLAPHKKFITRQNPSVKLCKSIVYIASLQMQDKKNPDQ